MISLLERSKCSSNLEKSKFERGKLMEISGEGDSSSRKVTRDETGAKVERERADGYEPPAQESV
mgnify:CR=1 FL=1